MVAVRVRLAGEADAAAVAAIYRPYVLHTAACFELAPPDEAEMARRIAEVGAAYPWLVAETDAGDVVGYAYGTRHRARLAYQWCTEVSVYIREGNQRGGVGRRLYEPLLALLRLQGFVNAYAVITLPNPASVAFHEALGFAPVTVFRAVGHKLGAWHDVGWYLRVLQPHPPVPSPPLAIADLLGTPNARHILGQAAGA